ncbi:hypothetical protein [Neotabrizicola sp. VNH66]|uniref:hypothetical protein n=1 Tax=Neotabrizicola sp. VNH66 TaxID=3400918 RepID=UPI003C0BD416
MGPISSLRPVTPVTGAAHSLAHGPASGSDAQGSSRTFPAAPPETARPVAPASGGEHVATGFTETGDLTEHSRARLEEAQRAYVAAVKAVGLNPLANPAP